MDRTARPQTVNSWNPGYLKILEEFDKQTGVGGVLNTSLNVHGYPLVGTPDMGVFTFENSDLRYMAFGNWLLKK
jgi:carbamoyltransferase